MRLRLNGLDFSVEIEGIGPPLLLLHGFTGSVRSWDELGSSLTAGASQIIALDLIGHGQSATPPQAERYTLEAAVADLEALLNTLELSEVNVLGYSLGGRVALHFATAHPRRVARLILESASPGIEDEAERARRVESDEALADRILRNGIAAFVDEWERQPLLSLAPHVSDAVRRRQHDQRRSNDPLGLANSLRGMGAGRQTPLWSQLDRLTMPVHLVVGALDPRYCAIAERMQRCLPHGEVTVVPEAGHTVHLDQPKRFADLVQRALVAG